MAQKKGKTGNPNGRPKGTPNKTTAEIKSFIVKIIGDNFPSISEDFKQLEPQKRLAMWEKLLSYVIPKQQSISTEMDFSKLTDEQINEIINNLQDSNGTEL